MRTPLVAAIALSLLVGTAATAQQPDPLRGPAVKADPSKPTLVERDFAGKLKALDAPPEEVALGFVKIDAETKSSIDHVLAERAQILDKIVIDNLDLVVGFYNARLAGDRRTQISLLTDLVKTLQPLNARGTLASEIRSCLPAEQAQQFDALITEYRNASAEDAMAEASKRGERLSRRQVDLRENLQTLGLEIKRSYERQIAARVTEFDQIIGQLGLNPDQETRIRNMVTDFGQQTKGKATAEQKRGLFFKIMSQLDQEQQQRLVSLYLGRTDPKM